MFGYIVINQQELKFKEFDRYHAYYCGLCRDLRRDYGLAGQSTLSYDLTFLAMLLSSLYEPKERMEEVRCIVHPLKKHRTLRNEYTAYAAAMNMLLAYYKAKDDWLDEHRADRLVFSRVIKNNCRNIVKKYPEKGKIISSGLREITRLEKAGETDLDRLSGCFGEVMRTIFAYREDLWEDTLGEIGFYLGKYVYLLDAYDDREKDLKKNNYNPLNNMRNIDNANLEARVEEALQMMIAECARAFERLPLLRDAEVLRNILYSGAWLRYTVIRSKSAERKDGQTQQQ